MSKHTDQQHLKASCKKGKDAMYEDHSPETSVEILQKRGSETKELRPCLPLGETLRIRNDSVSQRIVPQCRGWTKNQAYRPGDLVRPPQMHPQHRIPVLIRHFPANTGHASVHTHAICKVSDLASSSKMYSYRWSAIKVRHPSVATMQVSVQAIAQKNL